MTHPAFQTCDYHFVTGRSQTITRAELLPLVQAAEQLLRSFTQWIDNLHVVTEALRRLGDLRYAHARPYALLKNGDLWQRFDKAVAALPKRIRAVIAAKGGNLARD